MRDDFSLGLAPYRGVVRPDWIDFNGHMNVACYVMAFDQAADGAMEALGLGPDYRARTGWSTFVVEAHITYQRELVRDDPFEITGRLVDFDAKRIRTIQLMNHGRDGHRVATLEWLMLHVDMRTRRTRPFPDEILSRLASIKAREATTPLPEEVGRAVGLGRMRAS